MDNPLRDLSQNEAIEVMQKYLSLFEQESSDFLYHFMENSLLDWYGRSVRGANRIHEYLRRQGYMNLKHKLDYQQSKPCSPIEFKSNHFKTKTLNDKDIDNIHRLNRVDRFDNAIEETSQEKKIAAEKSQEDEVDSMANANTKRKKIVQSDDSFSSDEEERNCKRKMLNVPTTDNSASYTRIRYVECIGNVETEDEYSKKNPARVTRLRISYRRSLTDGDIKFILIIYEDVKRIFGEACYWQKSRCNLMSKIGFLTKKDLNGAGDGCENANKRGTDCERVTTPLSGRVQLFEEGITPLKWDDDSKDDDDNASDGRKQKKKEEQKDGKSTKSMSPAHTILPTEAQTIANDITMLESLNNADTSVESKLAHLRTPTKARYSPLISPVRKPRSTSCKRTTSPLQKPTPKRSAARSLRL